MVLGCAFMVFSGVMVLVYLREVGFALSLMLCGGGVCVCVCVGWGWVGVGGASLSGESWGLSFWGEQDGISLLAEGRVWGLITGNHVNQCLVNSTPVEAFEMHLRSSHPSQKSAENDSDRLQEQKFTDFSPILGPKTEQNSALIEASFLEEALSFHSLLFLFYQGKTLKFTKDFLSLPNPQNPWKRLRKYQNNQGKSLLKMSQGNPKNQGMEGQGAASIRAE